MAAYLPPPEDERPQGKERRHRDERGAEPRPQRNPSRNRDRDHVDRRGRPTFWQYSCGLCQDDHALSTCRRFRDQTPYQRYETVERRGYCRNCLARSHLAPDCQSIAGCRRCEERHHTLLHGAPQLENMERPADDFAPANNARPAPTASPPFKWDLVFVPTAMVRIAEDGVDTWATVRALINQSSTMSRLAYSTFRRLGLRSCTYQGNRFTTFRLMHRSPNSNWALKINALITDALPFRPYSDPLLEDPTRDLAQDTLADTDPRANTSIDLELGADVYPRLQRDGHVFAGLATSLSAPSGICLDTKLTF